MRQQMCPWPPFCLAQQESGLQGIPIHCSAPGWSVPILDALNTCQIYLQPFLSTFFRKRFLFAADSAVTSVYLAAPFSRGCFRLKCWGTHVQELEFAQCIVPYKYVLREWPCRWFALSCATFPKVIWIIYYWYKKFFRSVKIGHS